MGKKTFNVFVCLCPEVQAFLFWLSNLEDLLKLLVQK